MSNNAQLLISDQDGEPMTDADWDAEARSDYVNLPLLESEYTVPLFWLALFSPDNIKTYWDEDNEEDTPYLVAPASQAKARFDQRLPELRKAFRNLDDFLPSWQQTLDKLDRDFVKVDLFEVLDMSEDGPELLAPALCVFEDLSEDKMVALMRLSDFPAVFDPKTQCFVDRETVDGRTALEYLMGSDPWEQA